MSAKMNSAWQLSVLAVLAATLLPDRAAAGKPMALIDRRQVDVVQGCTAQVEPEVLILLSPLNPKGALTIKPEMMDEAVRMMGADPTIAAPAKINVKVVSTSVEARQVDYREHGEAIRDWPGYSVRSRVRVTAAEGLAPGQYRVRIVLPGVLRFAEQAGGERILALSPQLQGEPGIGYDIAVNVYESAGELEDAQRQRWHTAEDAKQSGGVWWLPVGVGLCGLALGLVLGYLVGRKQGRRSASR